MRLSLFVVSLAVLCELRVLTITSGHEEHEACTKFTKKHMAIISGSKHY
jgi:hypothetical protein